MTPYPLGRIERHDPRSLNFRAPLVSASALDRVASVNWQLYGRVVDQGDVGACTAHALVNVLNCRPYHRPRHFFTEAQAMPWYTRATELDQWPGSYPPDDTGSDSISACKAAMEAGVLSGYRWAFGFEELLRALPLGPVMVGTDWCERMFYPDSKNIVTVSGPVVGGHEYVISAYNRRSGLLKIVNSWGWEYGLRGCVWVRASEFAPLIENGGDVCVPVLA